MKRFPEIRVFTWVSIAIGLLFFAVFPEALAQNANPINPLENPVILAALALSGMAGVPGTKWLTEYAKTLASDAGARISSVGIRLVSIACGLVVAGGLALLHFFDSPVFLEYPMWLRILGMGLFFGVTASAWHDAQNPEVKP